MTAIPAGLQLVLTFLALLAAFYDLRFRRVPNWLVAAGLVLGIVGNSILFGFLGLLLSMKGFGLALLIYIPLYLARGMGGGDVKLMAAVGALVGPVNWLVIFVLTGLIGGVIAIVFVLVKGRLRRTLHNVASILQSMASRQAPYAANPELDVRTSAGVGLPHAAVIALGIFAFLIANSARS